MLLQSTGILTALLFVLGLVGVAAWVAKRFGGTRVNPRSRIAIEVVQRVPFGPKTGIAVIRVGEKVMAVSVGPDGMRPLFEVAEADRERVLATSQQSTPFAMSADAGARASALASQAFTRYLPARLRRLLGRAPSLVDVPASAPALARVAPIGKGDDASAEVPAFLTNVVAHPTRHAPRVEGDFGSMLNIAMSGATRLAVVGGLMLLSTAVSTARAQVSPPVPPVIVPPVVAPPVAVPPLTAPPSVTAPAVTPAVLVPQTPPRQTPQPAFVVPTGVPRLPRAAPLRTAAPRAASPTAANAAQARTQRADSTKVTPPQKKGAAPLPNGPAATPAPPIAPVAGADGALARLLPQIDLKMGDTKDGGLRLSGTVGIVVMMGLLTLVPTLVLMMTGFTRILIVLHFLKQAMGTQSAPPAQLLGAMALLLTGFVMAPTLREMNTTAVEPWMAGRITQVEMLETGIKPLRVFMLKQTRTTDLRTFIDLSRLPQPNTVDDVPLHVLVSAFVASELRSAFQIGFMIYLPFIVIDAVVASVLMSMGMFMLPPAMISMPFKLLLFVLVDGWGLTIQALVQSFK